MTWDVIQTSVQGLNENLGNQEHHKGARQERRKQALGDPRMVFAHLMTLLSADQSTPQEPLGSRHVL